jgi:glycosyltransferase involved in cell wall biosynthesis
MRVLHLTRDLPGPGTGPTGGLSTAVSGLLAAAQAAGLPHAALSFDGYRPRRGPSGAPPRASAARDLARGIHRVREASELAAAAAFAAAFRPDLVHVHHALLWDTGEGLARQLGASTCYTAHVLQGALSALRGLSDPTASDLAEISALHGARRVSVPTAAARAALCGLHRGLPETAVAVTPLAVERPDEMSEMARSHEGRSLSDATSHHVPRLAVVGRFDPLKGTDTLLEAAPALLARVPGLELVVMGGVPESPKAARRWEARLSEAAAGSDRFHVKKWGDASDVARLLRGASHFLTASRAETCGLALMEARAAGLGLIASDLPAHREVAPEATFFPPGDPEGLSEAVVAALACSAPWRAGGVPRWAEVLPAWRGFWGSAATP